eukprot:TRINITY_DN14393_c0_g8_i1.p1 TRINITY_DN14393_c0_g8~~TRINITY_DN14393_c0_g8_i1.p1  ORF type:complete len:574 (-),score=60.91 TRINITY_DN14393_c0_g8_i1:567-2246(-)
MDVPWSFVLLLFVPVNEVLSLDNGIARTPMGWTSWTSAWLNPNQSFMQSAMDAILEARSNGFGKPLSLRSLGYEHIGLDDGWQSCGSGWNGSFHDRAGHPLVNLTRFPNMTEMTEYGHARGLNVGWYLNNCFCQEHGWTSSSVDAHYKGDVEALAAFGFSGAKFDACGQFLDLTRWSNMINATDQPMMVENCHWGGDAPYYDKETGDLWCPYNIYRTGMDIVPGNWESFLTNLASQAKFINAKPPLSMPGCWAYADSVQTGTYSRLEEDRSHFGAWCITSSPLVLGMDITNSGAVERVWHIITNTEAIAVNQRWAGHPGWLVNETKQQLPIRFAHALPCEANASSQRDWFLGPADAASGVRKIQSKSTGLCVDVWSKKLTLEPCTGNVSQQFVHDNKTGAIHVPHYPNNQGELNGCVDIVAKTGPGMQLTKCYGQPNDVFFFSEDGVWSDQEHGGVYPRRCVQVEHGYASEAQLWMKPQPNGAAAIFAFSTGSWPSVSFEVDLVKLGLTDGMRYAVRDIWNHVDLAQVSGKLSTGAISNHDSVFYLLTPLTAGAEMTFI